MFEAHKDTSPRLDKDLKRARIPKWTQNGKIDFHSLRNVCVSNIIEAGATVKEAQSLARHSTPNLTINTYARASQKRLAELAEKASENMRITQKCATGVLQNYLQLGPSVRSTSVFPWRLSPQSYRQTAE